MAKAKAIIRIDDEGNEQRYASVAEAAEDCCGKKDNIRAAAHGRSKSAYGYRWKFAEEEA